MSMMPSAALHEIGWRLIHRRAQRDCRKVSEPTVAWSRDGPKRHFSTHLDSVYRPDPPRGVARTTFHTVSEGKFSEVRQERFESSPLGVWTFPEQGWGGGPSSIRGRHDDGTDACIQGPNTAREG